jgi:hypothetical protein
MIGHIILNIIADLNADTDGERFTSEEIDSAICFLAALCAEKGINLPPALQDVNWSAYSNSTRTDMLYGLCACMFQAAFGGGPLDRIDQRENLRYSRLVEVPLGPYEDFLSSGLLATPRGKKSGAPS